MATMFLTSTTAMADVITKLKQLQVESGAVDDMQRLDRTTNRIRALLRDAEQMEIHDDSTRLWLADLSEVVCEAQDLVDELEYEIVKDKAICDDDDHDYHIDDNGVQELMDFIDNSLKRKSMKINDTNFESFSSTRYTNLSSALADIIADRVKRINQSIDEIWTSRSNLRLTSEDGTRRPDCRPKYPLPTSHVLNTSQVFGREEDKNKIVNFLIRDSSCNNFAVLSVVGKGGIGKTTIAQLVYNDPTVSEFFHQKIWICVSLEFDIVKLTRDMVEPVLLPGESCNSSQLGSLQNVLQSKLAGKKVLLVLDDVWTLQRDLWEKCFKTPLDNGKQLVRILLTTRNEEIYRIVEGVELYHLGYLSDNKCWELFKSRVFCGQNFVQFPHLENIGQKIVRKSGGLPLVVKSLAGILQDSTDLEMWNNVLESRLWELKEDNEVLPILQLSYNCLPTYLKPCFLSCTVFPKDYPLKKDEVVHLWIALGYIQSKNRSLEDEGNDYFDELHKRSFFDPSTEFGSLLLLRYYKMHDSIHDLALHISHNICSAPSSIDVPELQSTIRLRALVCNSLGMDSLTSLIGNIKHLRFLVINKHLRFPKDFQYLYNLRVLFIHYVFHNRKLPVQIGNLINLIYLKLNMPNLESLPESMCKLYNLVTLDLSDGRSFYFLPCLPPCFGNLCKLERLHLHSIANTNVIRELKKLVNLRGTLRIDNIKNLTDVAAAQEIDLKNKPKIEDLKLSWFNSNCGFHCKCLHLFINCENDHLLQEKSAENKPEDVLECLQPHTNLRSLEISDYYGVKFSRWLGDPSFTILSRICLAGSKTSYLPTLGELPLLQYLQIKQFLNLKIISDEFCRSMPFECGLKQNQKMAFPSLLRLEFDYMNEWEELHGVQDHDFPNLQELTIARCPFLTTLPVQLIKNLNSFVSSGERCIDISGEIKLLKNLVEVGNGLRISGLGNILNFEEAEQASMKTKQKLDILILDFEQGDGLNNTDERLKKKLYSGLHFSVSSPHSNCISAQADNIQAAVLESLEPHTNLRELYVDKYDGVSFPHWIGNPSFTKLTVLVISECGNMNITSLPTLGQLPFLEYLSSVKISHVKTIGYEFCRFRPFANEVAFPSLLELVFKDMLNLEGWYSVRSYDFPKLKLLRIVNCPMLASIPTFSSISSVYLEESILMSCLPTLNSCLPLLQCLVIKGNSNVERIGCEFLRNLPCKNSLREDQKAAFPSLMKLEFYDMDKWDEWYEVQNQEFSQPQELIIMHCPLLTTLPVMLMTVSFDRGLFIYRMRNIINEEDVKQANIKTKHLNTLILNFGWRDLPNAMDEYNGDIQAAMLESLQPHIILSELQIYGYNGASFPRWLGDPSFTELTVIIISECVNTNITSLPTLGQLPSLEHIMVEKIPHVKIIGYEFCRFVSRIGDSAILCDNVAFPSLVTLVFGDMLELEWCSILGGDFPKLTYLRISNCPMLASIPTVPSSVSSICLEECRGLQCLNLNQASCNFLYLPRTGNAILHSFRLGQIILSGCTIFTVLPTLGHSIALKYLKIEKILYVKTIGHEFCRFGSNLNDSAGTCYSVSFPFLKELVFSDMPELEEWIGVLHGDFPRLETLRIANCPKLAKVPSMPSSVSELCLWECSSLKALHLAQDNICPSKLKKVVLQNCAKLGILTGKHNLDDNGVEFCIYDCPVLEFDHKKNSVKHELVRYSFEDPYSSIFDYMNYAYDSFDDEPEQRYLGYLDITNY